MIFVDSNIPMFLMGQDHPLKHRASELLHHALVEEKKLVSSVEVYQEIIHRYAHICRYEAIQPTFDLFAEIIDEVYPVCEDDTQLAKTILLENAPRLSARDALHVATMKKHQITHILSFDKDFDQIRGIKRLA